MNLETFRTGGVSVNWRAFGLPVLVVALLWLGAWLLSWHFVRVLGLFVIVLAALAVHDWIFGRKLTERYMF